MTHAREMFASYVCSHLSHYLSLHKLFIFFIIPSHCLRWCRTFPLHDLTPHGPFSDCSSRSAQLQPTFEMTM